jgi:Domain of unknown function (DUF4129)
MAQGRPGAGTGSASGGSASGGSASGGSASGEPTGGSPTGGPTGGPAGGSPAGGPADGGPTGGSPAGWRAGRRAFGDPAVRALAPRLALAAVLVAIVLAGVRAALPQVIWQHGPWRQHGVLLGIGLEVVFAALLVALEVRRRRWPEPGMPTAGLRRVLRGALGLAAAGILVLILLDSAGHLTPGRPRVLPPRRPPPGRLRTVPVTTHAAGGSGPDILYAVLALALAAAVVIAVILLRRSRGRDWGAVAGEIVEDEPAEQLRQAVRSGQAALGEIDDARLAIIACYVAMERSLGRAGAVRGAAETPDELLARAAQGGIVGGGEAAALTALFYEARFSSHPLPAAKRREAQQALDVLAVALDAKAADLRRAAEAQAAAQAAAAAGAGRSGRPA